MTKTGQPQYDNVSVRRDISFALLTQYDEKKTLNITKQ